MDSSRPTISSSAMGSRVCDIKKKFEGLNDSSKDQNLEQAPPPKFNNSTRFSGQKPHSNQTTNCSQVGIKGNIKRSHAFRSDRAIRTTSISESIGSQPDSRLSKFNHANRPLINSNGENQKTPKITENKMIRPMSNNVIKSNAPISNRCTSNLNNKFSKTVSNAPSAKEDSETKMVVTPPVEYSMILKDSQRSKPSKLMKPSMSSNKIGSKCEGGQESIKMESTNKSSETALDQNISRKAEPSLEVKLARPTQTSENNNATNSHRPTKSVEGGFDSHTLSNTLKKVLSSPLPSGPPPKKPPRTFAHTVEWNTETPDDKKPRTELCLHSNDDLSLKLSKSENFNKQIVRPLRSKTESQIMLKKLEVALQKHKQQGKIVEPKIDKNEVCLNEKHNQAFACPDSYNLKGKQSLNKQEDALPDTPKDKYGSNSGCFGVGLLSCSNSMDLVRSSHIYDVPFESKSQFYLKDINDVPSLNSFLGENSSSITESRLRPNTLDYGKINCVDQFKSTIVGLPTEPVYAKPAKTETKSQGFTKSPRTSVSEIIKSINKNEIENFGKDKQPSKPTVLHYMVS